MLLFGPFGKPCDYAISDTRTSLIKPINIGNFDRAAPAMTLPPDSVVIPYLHLTVGDRRSGHRNSCKDPPIPRLWVEMMSPFTLANRDERCDNPPLPLDHSGADDESPLRIVKRAL